MSTLIARLARCYTGAVHDVLRTMGHDNFVLPHDIKAIAPGTRLAGPIWTVAGRTDRTLTRDECLRAWCTLLARAPTGHVVVCQPNNREIALMGELSAQTLAARGVLGYVVDGGSRDTDLVLEQGFPVFCAFLIPWCLASAVRGRYLGVRRLEAALAFLVGVFTVVMLGRWGVVLLLTVFD